MKLAALIAAFVCCIAAWAAPVHAQRTTHWSGGGGFSPDGSLLAFYVQGRPANEIVVLEVATGRSVLFGLPAPHIQLEDLAWAPSSNTLMFVSLDPGATESILSERSIIGGYGTHIWSIAFTAEGPLPAKVIARGQGLRRPAASPDGSKVAYFEPVLLPSEVSRREFVSTWAYAVFERDMVTGEVVRVAETQYATPRRLFYDGKDAWLFSADDAQYPRKTGDREFWGPRPAPPGKGTFNQLASGINSFRMSRGDVLPQYPDYTKPYPDSAPPGAWLAGTTPDGRPILFGRPGNSAARQQLRMVLGDVPALAQDELREGYMALKADGSYEVYFAPEPPGEFHWDKGGSNVGGAGVDGTLKRYFIIQETYDSSRKPEEDFRYSRLFIYDEQALALERDIADILAKATKVAIVE